MRNVDCCAITVTICFNNMQNLSINFESSSSLVHAVSLIKRIELSRLFFQLFDFEDVQKMRSWR